MFTTELYIEKLLAAVGPVLPVRKVSKLVIVSVKVPSDETISSVEVKNGELRIVATVK